MAARNSLTPLYYPNMTGAVTEFRHQALLDYIEAINKKTQKPAMFYLTQDGLTAAYDPYHDWAEKMSPWHTEYSMNFLEATGKIRLLKGTRKSPDMGAVVAELESITMPPDPPERILPEPIRTRFKPSVKQ